MERQNLTNLTRKKEGNLEFMSKKFDSNALALPTASRAAAAAVAAVVAAAASVTPVRRERQEMVERFGRMAQEAALGVLKHVDTAKFGHALEGFARAHVLSVLSRASAVDHTTRKEEIAR